MLFHHMAIIGVAVLSVVQLANLFIIRSLVRRIKVLENKPSCCPPVSDL